MRLVDIVAGLRSSGAATARAVRRRLAELPKPSRQGRAADSFDEETFEEASGDPFQWQTVTILAQPWDIAPDGRLPAPLAEFGDLIEARLELAPGGRGTQLSARTTPGPKPDSTGWKGENPARRIRTALQHARQLIETGEVLAMQPQPAGKRRPARGLLVGLVTGDADQEGVV